MANFTKNLNLKKPLQTEFYNVDDFNENADIIDEKMGEAIDHHKDYSNPHKTTADGVKASKMFTSGEINTYTTVLEACNALKYGGGFVVSSVSPICNADDYPQKGYEFAFHVICEANEARKTVIAYIYHGGKMNVFQRNIFRGAWETTWKSTDQAYLSLSGGTLSGYLGVGGGKGTFSATDVYSAFQTIKDGNNFRYLRAINPLFEEYSIEKALQFVDTVNGKETVYNIFGEHNKHLMGVSFIGNTGAYTGGGDEDKPSTLEFDFDFPVKFFQMGKRAYHATKNEYQFEFSAFINIEALLLNDYNGKAITTKAQLNPENTTPTTITVSADRKKITISADTAYVGMNRAGNFYFYNAIG